MSLNYTRSTIYPDSSIVKWEPREYHTGLVNRKVRFRVIIDDDNQHHHLEFFNENYEWESVGSFHSATEWSKWQKMDPAWAEEYGYYLALHRCHSLAEKITKERIFKNEHQSTTV